MGGNKRVFGADAAAADAGTEHVTISVSGQSVSAKGPKGELNFVVSDHCTVEFANDEVSITPVDKSKIGMMVRMEAQTASTLD